jgi:hypothetical protein
MTRDPFFGTRPRGGEVPHEITLIAFTPADYSGNVAVCDIIETSFKLAHIFTRKWVRDPDITEIAAGRPGTPLAMLRRRKIRRA